EGSRRRSFGNSADHRRAQGEAARPYLRWIIIAGHSASEDARERAYDPAIYPLRKKGSCEKRWTPGSSPGVTPRGWGGSRIYSGESNGSVRSRRNDPHAPRPSPPPTARSQSAAVPWA